LPIIYLAAELHTLDLMTIGAQELTITRANVQILTVQSHEIAHSAFCWRESHAFCACFTVEGEEVATGAIGCDDYRRPDTGACTIDPWLGLRFPSRREIVGNEYNALIVDLEHRHR
jgi:hypothetical protein